MTLINTLTYRPFDRAGLPGEAWRRAARATSGTPMWASCEAGIPEGTRTEFAEPVKSQ